jgi:hypothetical protein
VYLAGPLFTPYERGYLDECAARLRERGFEVFVPGIVGLLTDLRSLRLEEGHGLNLFVEGCIEAGGEVTTSLEEAIAALERFR